MTAQPDLLVVGAGPAGLAAAAAAGGLGLSVVVADENPQAGGQYYRQPLIPSSELTPDRRVLEGAQRIALAASVADLRMQTAVVGIDAAKHAWLDGPAGVSESRPRCIVLATGSFDRPVAFPGWTMPGVITAGGAQALAKGQRVSPGQRVLIAGTGPLSLVVAAEVARRGAHVVEVIEAATPGRLVRHMPRGILYPSRARELPSVVRQLAVARTRVTLGSVIASVEGQHRAERAVVVRLRRDGRPDKGSARSVAVDLVCTGYGFAASTELARMVDCELIWDPGFGQLVPGHDAWQQTSVPGVFVAGEATGLGGAEVAEAEGALAGIGAARLLGSISREAAEDRARPVRQHLRRWRRFAEWLGTSFPIPAALSWLAREDTIACRCEDVPLGDVLRQVRIGASCMSDLKVGTRCGLGLCQGRTCGALLPSLIGDRFGRGFDRASVPSARPPIRPVLVASVTRSSGDGEVGGGTIG